MEDGTFSQNSAFVQTIATFPHKVLVAYIEGRNLK
jgi:hypothetical protein